MAFFPSKRIFIHLFGVLLISISLIGGFLIIRFVFASGALTQTNWSGGASAPNTVGTDSGWTQYGSADVNLTPTASNVSISSSRVGTPPADLTLGELGSNVLGYWKFNEGSGTTALDSSGFGRTGTLNGGSITYGTGENTYNTLDSSVYIPSTFNFITIPQASFKPTTALTIELWHKPTVMTSAQGNRNILDGSWPAGAGANGGYVFIDYPTTDGNILYFQHANSDNTTWTTVSSDVIRFQQNQWYHLAVVFDSAADTLSLYLNGTLVGQTADTETIGYTGGNNTIVVGARYFQDDWRAAPGYYDNLVIYDRAVPQTELIAHAVQTREGATGTLVSDAFDANLTSSWDSFTFNHASAGASSTLTGAITDTAATSFAIADSTSRFTVPAYLKIENEIIYCTTKIAATYSGCTRGVSGTTAATHADGTIVTANLTVIAFSTSNNNSTWSNWVAPSPLSTQGTTLTGLLSDSRYIRYKVLLYGDGISNADFNSVTINYTTLPNTAPAVDSITITKQGDNDLEATITTSDSNLDTVLPIIDWQNKSTGPYVSATVLNMPFEPHASSSTVALDYSTYGNDGTVNSATLQNTSSAAGSAYTFTGALGSNINIPTGTGNLQAFTYCSWINSDGTKQYGVIASRGSSVDGPTGQAGWNLQLSDANLLFTIPGGNTTPAGTIIPGQWHHVCAVYNGTNATLYLDGSQITTTAIGGPIDYSTTASMRIGAYASGDTTASWRFSGSMDEVLYFSRALSLEQITNIYNKNYNILASQEITTAGDWQVCVTPNDGTLDGTQVCEVYVPGPAPAGGSSSYTPPCSSVEDAHSFSANIVSQPSKDVVELTWVNTNTNPPDIIEVRRGPDYITDAAGMGLLTLLPAGNTSFTDTGASPGSSYSYAIRSLNDCGSAGPLPPSDKITLPISVSAGTEFDLHLDLKVKTIAQSDAEVLDTIKNILEQAQMEAKRNSVRVASLEGFDLESLFSTVEAAEIPSDLATCYGSSLFMQKVSFPLPEDSYLRAQVLRAHLEAFLRKEALCRAQEITPTLLTLLSEHLFFLREAAFKNLTENHPRLLTVSDNWEAIDTATLNAFLTDIQSLTSEANARLDTEMELKTVLEEQNLFTLDLVSLQDYEDITSNEALKQTILEIPNIGDLIPGHQETFTLEIWPRGKRTNPITVEGQFARYEITTNIFGEATLNIDNFIAGEYDITVNKAKVLRKALNGYNMNRRDMMLDFTKGLQTREAYIRLGDINDDGTINAQDFVTTGHPLIEFDLNRDGVIDIYDYLIMIQNFGRDE